MKKYFEKFLMEGASLPGPEINDCGFCYVTMEDFCHLNAELPVQDSHIALFISAK
jgi:hypothetical protein